MRPSSASAHPAASQTAAERAREVQQRGSDWATLSRLFPYLWEYKWRVAAALTFMVGAKMANVGVPLLLK